MEISQWPSFKYAIEICRLPVCVEYLLPYKGADCQTGNSPESHTCEMDSCGSTWLVRNIQKMSAVVRCQMVPRRTQILNLASARSGQGGLAPCNVGSPPRDKCRSKAAAP